MIRRLLNNLALTFGYYPLRKLIQIGPEDFDKIGTKSVSFPSRRQDWKRIENYGGGDYHYRQ